MIYLHPETRLQLWRQRHAELVRDAELLRLVRERPLEPHESRSASWGGTRTAAARALVTGVWRRSRRLVPGASPEPL
jgi:hypothetical protein